jgi:hypothetical protein
MPGGSGSLDRKPDARGFLSRLAGAIGLDSRAYEDVEHDRQALPQALIVVVLSSIATGIGSVYPEGVRFVVPGTLFALAGLVAWSSLIYLIGTRLVPQAQTEADIGQLMRTTGFASAPGLLGVAGIVPGVGWILMLVVSVWMAAAMLVAVRQALDFTSVWRAVGVVVIGWLAYLAILVLARVLL